MSSPNKLEKLADKLWALELDLVAEGIEEVEAFASQFEVEAQVLTWAGPAGGWPVVRFTGTWHRLTKLRKAYES
jgi:hypothetical protein